MKWDAALYDTGHRFVSQYGEELVTLLAPRLGETILDAGCGTGDLAAMIAASGARTEGIDASEEMIAEARKKFPHLPFYVADITEYENPGFYDAVFSNATLHWITEKEKAAARMYLNLKPGGRLVLEMGGKGNVADITGAIEKVLVKHGMQERLANRQWYFPSLGEYAILLESAGFRVRYAVHFDRETELQTAQGIKNWIQMFGKDFFRELDAGTADQLASEIQDSLKPLRYHHDKWYADYKRLRIMATKEK